MSTYAYLCLDARGEEIRGQMEAPDDIAVRRRLREQGFKILDVVEGTLGGNGLRAALKEFLYQISRFRSVSDGDRVLFYHQMQLMLKAGHTLLEALAAAAFLTPKARLADILGRIAIGIQRGNSLSVACSGEKELFSRLALKLIEAGEASGELSAVFERLAALIERRAEVRRQLATALVYPGIVIVIAIGVIVLLVTTVVPRFAMFLAGRGKAVPWEAQALMDAADWFSRWGGWVGASAIGIIAAVPLLRRIPSTRLFIDRAALSIPVLGITLVISAMAQVTWVFSVLLKSRLTVLEALRICTQTSGNAAFSNVFAHAADDVIAGRTLAAALDRPVLPRLVQHMAAIGERSGQLDTVMESLGAHYQKLLDARVKLLATMIEPVLTVSIGGVVLFVYYAFFKTMLTVSTGGG
ncbi:MAG: type II secretion system F family protein [Azoarcus sp.]|nr:type II secretion system F family protein [Azoarcus sp.]